MVKNGTGPESISNPVSVTVREKPNAVLSSAISICETASGTLQVAVTNTFGNPWSLTYLEGTASKTLTGAADGSFNITSSPLSVSTDITLQSIILTHSPTATNPGNCINSLNSTSRINVTLLPNGCIKFC